MVILKGLKCLLYETENNPSLTFRFRGSCLRLLPMRWSEMQVEQMVAHRTHGNEENHRHVIEGWMLLEQLNLHGCSVDVTLVCPSLRDLTISGMQSLKTCKVVSLVLSELCLKSCPHLDVSSMILPSLECVDVLKCNVSAMAMIFDFDVCQSCVFL